MDPYSGDTPSPSGALGDRCSVHGGLGSGERDLVEPELLVPPGVDVTRASAARVYDFLLGGSHNFAADRELARLVLRADPRAPLYARANRAFLGRALRFAAGLGVDRVLDLGSGIPTVGAPHEIVAGARVVYVDVDAVAVAHTAQVTAGLDRVAAVRGDVTDPGRVLADPAVADLLGAGEPVAVLLVAVLHFVPGSADPAGLVACYREAVPPGSVIVVSHATAVTGAQVAAVTVGAAYARVGAALMLRTAGEVRGLLVGWDLVPPGVVAVDEWPRPDPSMSVGVPIPGVAAVAVKPAHGDPAARERR